MSGECFEPESVRECCFLCSEVDSRTSPKARVGFGEKYTTSDWHPPGRTKLIHFGSKKPKFDFSSESEDFELVFESVAFMR